MTTPAVGSVGGHLDPTVLDVLRGSPIGPMLDRPVSDMLRDAGLPQLPALPQLPPLPAMPTLPNIDPSALIQPALQLLQAFGTGKLGGGGGFDPTQLLSSVANALMSTASQGASANAAVAPNWNSDASDKAQHKSDQAQQDSAKVAQQGQQQKTILLQAQQVVAEGAAELMGVIQKFIAEVVAGGIFLFTPVGIPMLMGMATDAISEAGVIAAKTRGELTVQTGQMVTAGIKIPIDGVPDLGEISGLASEALNLVQPYLSTGAQVATQAAQVGEQAVSQAVSAGQQLVGQGAQALSSVAGSVLGPAGQALSAATAAKPVSADDETAHLGAADSGETTGSLGAGGGIGGMPIGAGGAGAGSPWQGGAPRAGLPGLGQSQAPRTGGQTEETETETTTTTAAAPGMMPGAGLAGAARGAEGGSDDEHRPNLVTSAHGDEVVGTIEGVSLPVVGAAEPMPEPPPDKELTL
ncbi:hypothetical protein [Nocardia sp. alder85J]|uniref:hypothetical protein n=1 Tax=Nocardia sp. alder85J TaxID=2862949 RepID=UPI001CD3A2E6|nr:hypothetical protein [Nocardia sp. alder85J]MCX4093033.1 hypothetical protein [Nocardia sp. alder85J]